MEEVIGGSQYKRYGKTHYERNKEMYFAANKNRKARTRSYLDTVKNVPCTDCGGSFPPCVMDFDHVGSDKEFTIGTSPSSVSQKRLEAEISKCDIVCANCHRIRTASRRGFDSL